MTNGALVCQPAQTADNLQALKHFVAVSRVPEPTNTRTADMTAVGAQIEHFAPILDQWVRDETPDFFLGRHDS